MNYFISDLHLGHANIIKLCGRPFATVEEMDEAFISAWNKKVKNADTVYIVGDLVWEKSNALDYINKLNGKKVLIAGNHDKKWLKKFDYFSYFENIVNYLEIKSNNIDITLCHYPMLEWKNSRKMGSKKLGYHIYGHLHNRYTEEFKTLFMMPHALNAGADVNGFVPVTLEELIKNNETYKLSKLTSLVDKAEFLALKYHLYQTDKVGKAYIYHPRAVASMLDDEYGKITALLHDTVEDSDIDINLLKSVFPSPVVDAVLTMTHKEDEDYFDYVERVSKNPLARRVKLCDLTHNMDLSRLNEITEYDLIRQEKYKKAKAMLLEGENMNNNINAMDKVLKNLSSYENIEVDVQSVEKDFDIIKSILDEYNLKLEKQKYEIEPTYIKYYFYSEKETVLKKALKLTNDVKLRLLARSIMSYIDNECSCVCFEIYNRNRQVVGLKELLLEPIENQSKDGLYAVIGKANNKAINIDITKMPHLFIAGATGSGKTVLINDIIVSLVVRYTPSDLKLLLIDPKYVDFSMYSGLPHLLGDKVVEDYNDVILSIDNLIAEMENRYTAFSNQGAKNIDEYNKNSEIKLPKIVVVVNEFNDLLLVGGKAFEEKIVALLQKCRATGIYLIVSNQMARDIPSTVMVCLPSRFALKVSSEVDSLITLGEKGAENLFGYGDMLYRTVSINKTQRAVVPFVSDNDIVNLVKELK